MERRTHQAGAVSLHILVLMVPVFLGLMGFALDLGQLYLARGELQTAAESMANAAAGRLIGTDLSTDDASSAARLMIESDSGFGNRYYYGSLNIGESTGTLNSEVVDPTYFATAAEASGEGDPGAAAGGEVSGTLARHVRVELTGEAPLTFWRFLSLGQEGKIALRVRAAAGVSAPVCSACATVPIAIAAADVTDTVNFGFVTDTRYTFGYACTGAPMPQPLAGSTQRLPYVILNRANDQLTTFSDDTQQLFRVGAQGLLPNTSNALACFTVGADESIWVSATQLACNTNTVQTAVTSFLCGVATRLDNSLVQGCANIPEIEALTALYTSDTDLTDVETYASYIGSQRRIITVAIVDALNPTGTMAVQGFRQFLIAPNQNTSGISPNDSNGRFAGAYIGSAVPLKQGAFGTCGVTSGPGKVVRHR